MVLFLFTPAIAAAAPALATNPVGWVVGGVATAGQLIWGLIRGAHKKKEALEDQISGVAGPWWKAQMAEIGNRLNSGTISAAQAAALVDEVESKFAEVTLPIKKGDSRLDQPRPGKGCNWACGSLWDVHEAGKGIKAEASRVATLRKPAPGVLAAPGAVAPGSVAPVVGLGILAYFLFK